MTCGANCNILNTKFLNFSIMTSENKAPKGLPKIRKGFASFLSNEDAAVSNKALMSIGAL